MRSRKRHSFLAVILVLGFGIPGSIGILVAQAKAIADQSEFSNRFQLAGTSTPTPTTSETPFATLSSTATSLPLIGAIASGPSSLEVYIQAPIKPVPTPYVILSAFSTQPHGEAITIRGIRDTLEFVCPASSCVVYLDGSARFVFHAYSDQGAVSAEIIASVSVSRGQTGYSVNVDSVNQFTTFRNACANVWGVYDEDNVAWDDFVQSPAQLNTGKTLHTLATQLLLNGIVDASDCTAGGLSVGLNWPTACGLERAAGKMLEWQNQYDEYIWMASRDAGVPPKILKTLIEIESQFWPGNQRFYVDEFGLGQINQLGVDVLLRRDPTFYQLVCPGVLSDCSHPYVSLDPGQRAMIRGAVVKQYSDATCATCENGLDLDKSKKSVMLLARVLEANCEQVDDILSYVALPDEDVDAATATAAVATVRAGGENPNTRYEDLWRFTLVSYHSGANCFQQALVSLKKDHQSVTWENLAKKLKCKGGEDYVNGFMETLFVFDTYRYQLTDLDVAVPVPTLVPTRTAIPTPTVFLSTAQVKVQVFMDRNANRSPDEGEWIDAMSVLLTTSSNELITQRTQNGITVFDMSGFAPGIGINVSLPGLYRDQSFVLPEQGEILITFIFDQPVLPTSIP